MLSDRTAYICIGLHVQYTAALSDQMVCEAWLALQLGLADSAYTCPVEGGAQHIQTHPHDLHTLVSATRAHRQTHPELLEEAPLAEEEEEDMPSRQHKLQQGGSIADRNGAATPPPPGVAPSPSSQSP
eukprot:scaffold68008_cov21-Tisochrysis_lutea.AAC.1